MSHEEQPGLKPELPMDRFQSSLRNLFRSMSGDWCVPAILRVYPFVVPTTMTKWKTTRFP